MTSKLVVNTIESDTGISSVSFASSISMSSTSKFHFSAAGIDIGADTNINRPAAGVLGFNVNGAEKVRIDSSGHMHGVGVVTATHFYGDGSNLTGLPAGTTINSNTNNYLITGTGTANTLQGESGLTWTGSVFQLTSSGGNQFPFNIRNDFTPNTQRSDYGYFANSTSNNTLRLGSINSNGGVTIQSTRMNDSAQKHNLLLNPDGGNVGVGIVSPDQTLEVFKASGTNLVKVSTQANSTVGLEIEKTGATTQSWRIVDGQTVNGSLEFYDVTDSATRLLIDGSGIVKITGNSSGQLNLRRSTSTDQEAIFYYGSSSLEIETREATSIKLKTNKSDRVKIQADGNVGIARTTNNVQTSSTNSLYNLSINRESNAHAYDGLNKSLNVDNQYTVQTFRSTNTNRNGTQAWFDVAHFRAWDINARVIIQAGGTFTGDQINIDVQSSYNSALGTGRAGPVLEVKRTEGHSGGRFTKVRIGCAANRQPILQVYFDGNATHNQAGSINVTVHDYGSNYGNGAHRGEAKFATATSLTETWESLDIDQPHCDYFNTSTTPAFSVFKADNSNQIGSGVYAFNSQILDRGGDNYNTSNGRFTAPCDGVYYFIATLQMYGGSSTVHARFQKNGVDVYNNGTNTPYYDEKHSTHANLQPFCLVELSTDDYVECVRNGSTRGMQSAMIGFLVR